MPEQALLYLSGQEKYKCTFPSAHVLAKPKVYRHKMLHLLGVAVTSELHTAALQWLL